MRYEGSPRHFEALPDVNVVDAQGCNMAVTAAIWQRCAVFYDPVFYRL
jgi:hypothetical protein